MAQFSVKVEIDEEKFSEMIEEFKKNNPDFIEVVRCKNCNYHDNKGQYDYYVGSDVHYCTKLKFDTRDDDYCSFNGGDVE